MKSSADLKNSSIAAIFHFAKNLDAYRAQGVPNQVQKEMIALFIELNKLIGYLALSQQDLNQIKNLNRPKVNPEEYKKLKRCLELHYKNNSDLNTVAMDIGENITYTNRLLQHGIDYLLENLKTKDFKNTKSTKAIVTAVPGKSSTSIPQRRQQVAKKKGGFFSFLFNIALLAALFYGAKYVYENYISGHAGTVQSLIGERQPGKNKPRTYKVGASNTLRIDGPTYMIKAIQQMEPQLKNKMSKLNLELHDGNSTNAIRKLIGGDIDIAASSRMPTIEERKEAQKRGKTLEDHKVAMDAVVVVVNVVNPIEGLSLDDLRKIYNGYARWSDFGWTGNFAKIEKFSGPPEGGTYAFFKDRVLYSEVFSEDVIPVVGTSQMMRMVENNPNAIAFIGAGDMMSFKTVRVLKLSTVFDNKPVSPVIGDSLNTNSLRRGEYPLTRYVYLITAGDVTKQASDLIQTVCSDDSKNAFAKNGLLSIY
jgi:phosphate transport system substrate-binding protein